jgi:hypothetical protein
MHDKYNGSSSPTLFFKTVQELMRTNLIANDKTIQTTIVTVPSSSPITTSSAVASTLSTGRGTKRGREEETVTVNTEIDISQFLLPKSESCPSPGHSVACSTNVVAVESASLAAWLEDSDSDMDGTDQPEHSAQTVSSSSSSLPSVPAVEAKEICLSHPVSANPAPVHVPVPVPAPVPVFVASDSNVLCPFGVAADHVPFPSTPFVPATAQPVASSSIPRTESSTITNAISSVPETIHPADVASVPAVPNTTPTQAGSKGTVFQQQKAFLSTWFIFATV